MKYRSPWVHNTRSRLASTLQCGFGLRIVRKKIQKRLEKVRADTKLALIACMRKLLLIIHDMVRNGEMWDPQKKKAGDQAVTNLATGTTCSAGH